MESIRRQSCLLEFKTGDNQSITNIDQNERFCYQVNFLHLIDDVKVLKYLGFLLLFVLL